MNTPTPMTRDEMRSLKARKDEEKRLQRVDIVVSAIYERAVNQAKTSSELRYKYAIPTTQGMIQKNHMMVQAPIPDEHVTFHNDNMVDILSNLRSLFPECSVEFKSITMAMGNDGKMHDVSDLDQKAMAFVSNTQTNNFITIDWS